MTAFIVSVVRDIFTHKLLMVRPSVVER